MKITTYIKSRRKPKITRAREKRPEQLGYAYRLPGFATHNKDPARNPPGMLRITGSQMAWEGCAAIQTKLQS
jgi:hypothetical protein